MILPSSPKPFVCWPVSLQVPGRPITFDRTRTALTQAAYIRRDRFELDEPEFVDFTKRGGDLVARTTVVSHSSPAWTRSPYLRWKCADEASDRTRNPEDIRAWHVVADLPAGLSAGQWLDRATELVSLALTPSGVADIAIHDPGGDTPPHAHILASSRIPLECQSYGGVDYDMYFALSVALRLVWREWLEETGSAGAHYDF